MEVEKIENIGGGGEGRNFSHFLHKKKTTQEAKYEIICT